MSEVLPFSGITRLNLNPDTVLQAAIGNMDQVVVIGYDKDGLEYFASSVADGADVNWLLDRCKLRLLQVVDRDV